MKTLTIIFAAMIHLVLSGLDGNSQTVAIGHVTAEVIESISAASKTINNLELATMTEAGEKVLNQSTSGSDELNLGLITLNSGSAITCNVVMKSAEVSDGLGNGFTIEPTVANATFASAASSNGSQSIKLSASTNRSSEQAGGLYEGSYTVVFAYN